MNLRPYQQDAHDAAMSWVRKCVDPCVIGAPTGAGKSFIIAAIADSINKMSGKRVLVLAPSGELVMQDYKKYLLTGNKASIFSASGGRKETRYPVVFGSPLTVSNNVMRFGRDYAAVIVDEAHGITPTLIGIIDHMRGANPNLRVIGLSATPYRMGSGYIYQHHYETGTLTGADTIDPYFHTLVYDIDARLLIDEGYLTPPATVDVEDYYDTSGLVMKSNGHWDQDTVDIAFEGHGRKTAGIIADVVARSAKRRGVMIYAATIKHAEEIMASLPPHLSALITGDAKKTPKKKRAEYLSRFGKQELKYLVSVGALTTGIDFSHVDVIAVLRATESPGLIEQIKGRGMRTEDGKDDFLFLDYAENIERHYHSGDIFCPDIKTRKKAESVEPIKSECPVCHFVNEFAPRQNRDNFDIDANGYFLDPLGQRIKTDYGDMPAHYGRRCVGESMIGGRHERCEYQWTYKECPECGTKNDIASRHCTKCKAEIVDPNEKLKEMAAAIARDPYRAREANVTGWSAQRWPGKSGKADTLRVRFQFDQPPRELSLWLAPESSSAWMRSRWHKFCESRWGRQLEGIDEALARWTEAVMPDKIYYRKNRGSKFHEITGLE